MYYNSKWFIMDLVSIKCIKSSPELISKSVFAIMNTAIKSPLKIMIYELCIYEKNIFYYIRYIAI